MYFEDVKVGSEIPNLIKEPTNIQLFRFSALTWNNHRIHYDKDYALTEGLPNIVVQSDLHGAFLIQMVTMWVGETGMLRRISWRNRGVALPGDELTLGGKITAKYNQNGNNYVEMELSETNQKGEILVQGEATVTLPSFTF